MTEYDYSPEAYQRAAATDKRIRNWRDMCDHQAPQFTTPFVHTPSEHHSRSRAVSPSSSESSLVDSTYQPHHHRSSKKNSKSKSKSKHRGDDHKSRSRSMSYSVPAGQQYDYHHPQAGYVPGVVPPQYASHDSARRSSSRHHSSSRKDKDRHRDRDSSHRDSKPSRSIHHQSPVTTPGLPTQYTTIPLGGNMYYSMPAGVYPVASPPIASPTYTAAPGQQSYFNMYPQQQQPQYYPSVVPPQGHAARSNSMPIHYVPGGQPGHYPTPGGSVHIVPPGSRPMVHLSSLSSFLPSNPLPIFCLGG